MYSLRTTIKIIPARRWHVPLHKTRLLQHDSFSDLQIAAQLLQADEPVAFPTDTVYGLGANALSESAVQKIYEAKGRPSDKSLIVLIHNHEQLARLTRVVPDSAVRLMEAFWPGQLTLIFPLLPNAVSTAVTRGKDTIGVRMPNHPTALKLLQLANLPIAAPSANLSGHPSAISAEQVIADLNGRIAAVVSGACSVGEASTIVDVTGDVPVILRQGAISQEQLEQTLGYTIKAVTQ